MALQSREMEQGREAAGYEMKESRRDAKVIPLARSGGVADTPSRFLDERKLGFSTYPGSKMHRNSTCS